MFDPAAITASVVDALAWHLQAINIRLFWTSEPQADPPYSIQLHQARESSPLREEITLLCRVANGEIDRASAGAELLGEIAETVQSIVEVTAGPPLLNQYRIDNAYWTTPIGALVQHVIAWQRGDDLIGYMEAGRLLAAAGLTREFRLEDRHEQKALVARVRRMVEAGDFTRYHDPRATNPTQAGRVSRSEVEAHIRQRLAELGEDEDE